MPLPFHHWHIETVTPVFVRIDGNVPHDGNAIINDFRLRRVVPTIQAVYQRGCPIILATHLDRPEGTYNASHSTAIIATWFARNGYHVEHLPYDEHASIETYMGHVTPRERTITVLENLRFFPGEKQHDDRFTHALSQHTTYYINDAWGMMHRRDTSVCALAEQFARTHRTYGHLVHQELQALSPLRNEAQHPYIILNGGAKISSKLPIIEQLVKHQRVDTIVVMPALAHVFLQAQGHSIGQSVSDASYIEMANNILTIAHNNNVTIDIPSDVHIVRNSWNHEMEVVHVNNIPEDGIIIASGPETRNRYAAYISQAHTIFLNGPMGDMQHFHTIQPFQQVLEMIDNSSAYRVVGGGDSVAMIQTLALDPFDFYSTGGGATLAYISGQTLPALDMMY